MRIRHSAAASLGALALVLTLSAPADAAEGTFVYTYSGLDGSQQTATLSDPTSEECITLPEVADPSASSPAHSPLNRTDARAVVFTDPGCEGDSFTLRAFTGHGSERLKLRSVRFV
ncbi:hypothetical protein [Streptomyces sp. RKAG293]|uniref:hypothetical protein n=1 Tax=Streptomyces sp. RKAG293 TaxID=2893403 RepID=UPI002033E4AA|nr:hypothetical protein [Streptomyces sp. RKAG293]MCM2419297.1 hypothetical protein [Streptomyces sp. RKAG293]